MQSNGVFPYTLWSLNATFSSIFSSYFLRFGHKLGYFSVETLGMPVTSSAVSPSLPRLLTVARLRGRPSYYSRERLHYYHPPTVRRYSQGGTPLLLTTELRPLAPSASYLNEKQTRETVLTAKRSDNNR